MIIDPHDPFKRRGEYIKNKEEELFFLTLNTILKNARLPMKNLSYAENIPIIYIVGAPRSGNTLLSQIVCKYLHVGYINNLIARFWLRPSVGIMLSKALLSENAREEIKFESSYGVTKEIMGPHEFGYFWRYWLKLDESPTHKLSTDHIKKIDKKGLKKAIEQEIIGYFNLPVVFRNPICGLNAKLLSEIHPVSLFVYIKRNFWDTVVSILHARKKRYGSYSVWWSLKPSTYPFNSIKNPVEEVITQVKECQREIEEELSQPGINFIKVEYEELCVKPLTVLEKICAEINKLGYKINLLSTNIPTFSIKKPQNLPKKLQKILENKKHQRTI